MAILHFSFAEHMLNVQFPELEYKTDFSELVET